MKELLNGVHVWRAWQEDRGMHFNGTYLLLGPERVLVTLIRVRPEV